MKFEEHIEEWKRLYEVEQLSFTEIAKRYNTTPRTVNRTLQGHVTVRPKSSHDSFGDEWLRLYKDEGYSKKDISAKYDVSYTIVNNVLKRKGVLPVSNPKKLKYQHLVQKWIKQYKELGMSLYEIGEQSGGISAETVRQYLEREGIEMRSYSEAIRQYDINEHYFDEIDSKEKAYHLGLVFAIGSVIDNFNSFILNLSVKNNNLVLAEKIMEALGETTFYMRERDGEISFRYSSRHLFDTLNNYGLKQDKDNKTIFPTLRKEYLTAFILGFWEGRGTFPYGKKGYIRFSASLSFLTSLKDLLGEIVEIDSLNMYYQENRNSYTLRISKKESYIKILDWIYDDNDFYTPNRVPYFYENKKMGIESVHKLKVYGLESEWIDFNEYKHNRTAFEMKLIEVEPVFTKHFQRESIYEKIFVFQNSNNGRLFKWKTRRYFELEKGKVYTFYADIEKQENNIVWFYRVLLDDFPGDKIEYVV